MIDAVRSPSPGRELAASVPLSRREAHARREAATRPPPGWKRPRRARSRIRTRELVLGPAREAARREAMPPADETLQVVPAELGAEAGLVGAALVGFEALVEAR